MPRAQPAMPAAPRYASSDPAYGMPAYAEGTYGAAAFPAKAYAGPAAPAREPAPRPVPERPKAAPPAEPNPQGAAKAAPPSPPEQEPEELPSDQELDKLFGPSREAAAAKAFASPVKDETTELDEEAIEALPDPKPLRPIGGDDGDIDLDEDIEPEDIPDPDPIPQVFGGEDDGDFDDEDEASGFSVKKLIAPTVSIVAVGAIVAGLVLGRETVVSVWPGANQYVYDLIGLHVMIPGDGLERKLTRTAIETVANVDHVIATGVVTNVSDREQPVPSLVVQLLDVKVQVLAEKEIKIDKAVLQPGEAVEFKAVFEGAPATARTVRTEWGRHAEAAAR